MSDQTRLNGVSEIGYSLLSDQLEANAVSFFNWGLLGIGGFFNVPAASVGSYEGNQNKLYPLDASSQGYSQGQIWQSFRRDWVFESGVEYGTQPIQASGVTVGGTFYPTTTVGAFAHHIDFPNGRVVFDSPIPTGSVVSAEYSYRYIHFTTADVPWWRQVETRSMRADDSHLSQGSGIRAILSESKIQLPTVVVEAIPITSRTPLHIGDLSYITKQDVLFHIMAETRSDFKQLHDIITYQKGKRFDAFDKNLLYAANAFPLNANGSIASGAKMFPELIAATGDGGYRWKQLRCIDTRSYNAAFTVPLYSAIVRATFEVDLP